MILRRIAAGERVRHYETVRTRKDGMRIDVSLTISPVIDSSGRVIAASVISRDISERVRSDRAIRASHRALQGLLMDMPLYGVVMSSDERIEFCNRALAAIVGAEPADLVGRDWVEVFGNYPEDQEAWKLFTEGYITPHYEGRVRDALGGVHHVFWSNVAYGEDDESEVLLASVGHDVTGPKAAAEELARRLAEYRRAKEAGAWLAKRLEAESDRFFRLGPAPLAPRVETPAPAPTPPRGAPEPRSRRSSGSTRERSASRPRCKATRTSVGFRGHRRDRCARRGRSRTRPLPRPRRGWPPMSRGRSPPSAREPPGGPAGGS
jgi:PAS domain S-box-containing protein